MTKDRRSQGWYGKLDKDGLHPSFLDEEPGISRSRL